MDNRFGRKKTLKIKKMERKREINVIKENGIKYFECIVFDDYIPLSVCMVREVRYPQECKLCENHKEEG